MVEARGNTNSEGEELGQTSAKILYQILNVATTAT